METNTRSGMASNAGWANSSTKVINAGKVDAYTMRKNQLTSNVLEQTDYSGMAPMTKKTIDMNNI